MQRRIETASFLVLVLLAALRPLVAESHDSARTPMADAVEAVDDPTPARTLVFDLAILLGTGGSLLARTVGQPRPYRRTGLEWGTFLLVIAAVIACLFAGNKRLAVNASVDWLCLPLLTISLVQLLRHRWQQNVLLAAILASAVAQSAQCVDQYFFQFDDTWAHYQTIKHDFWAKQGVDLESARVEAYERRMLAREAAGYLQHSNVTGAYLVLCGLAGLAVSLPPSATWQTYAHTLRTIGAMLAATAILATAALTRSRGALIAALAGGFTWLLVTLLRRRIDAHRRRAFLFGWLLVGLAALGVVGYGLHYDRLPGWSLTFRWQYWRASAEMIRDHPFTGVGPQNFGRHYLRYKSIQSPEEVSNPHNLFVQAASEYGFLGLFGVGAMLFGASRLVCGVGPLCQRRESLDPTRHGSDPAPHAPPAKSSEGAVPWLSPRMLRWGLTLLVLLTLCRLPLLGTRNVHLLYYASVTCGLAWMFGFALFLLAAEMDHSNAHPYARSRCAGMAMGMLAFLLQDMVNFASFVPGSATTLFALLADCITERNGQRKHDFSRPLRRPWLASVAVLMGISLVLAAGLVPVARAGRFLQRARSSAQEPARIVLSTDPAYRDYQLAAMADPLDPTPCAEQSRWLLALSADAQLQEQALELAGDAVRCAIKRDPFSTGPYRLQMHLYHQRATRTGRPEDYLAAIDAARKALELYPQDPQGLVVLADRQLEAAEALGHGVFAREAEVNYHKALQLDDQRLAWEELSRLRKHERAAIEAKLLRAQQR